MNIDFCTLCFASSIDGSWNHVVIGDYCSNCGSYGIINIPESAVDSIRKSASWVGKRYYPDGEDGATQKEIKALRALVTNFPGRDAIETSEFGIWYVTQKLENNSSASVTVAAWTKEDAIKIANLPYIPNI
jgi:hypothetical protein